jgi:DNA-binding Lrp family transcriptional regulator
MTIKVEKTMETCKNGVMDDLDRRIAVALQGNGRASWQQVARVVESSESTVARRAHRMFEAGLLRVAAISDPVRCGFGYPVLVQLRCEVGEEMRVAHALADRSDVRFVALVTGSFDIVMELIVPSRRYLAGVLLEELPKVGGIEDTTTETVLRNFKMTYDWSRELLGADGGQLEEPVVDRDGSNGSGLDGVDLQLYELLAEDGRRSFSDLASLVGMSESVVRRRVERLRASGCLRFATLVEPYLLGYDVECICWVHVDLSRLEETARTLAEHREVRYLSATIGYSDLICELILRSQDELYEFSTQTLGGLSGVRGVDIGLELRTIKRAYLRMSEPPPPAPATPRAPRWRGTVEG